MTRTDDLAMPEPRGPLSAWAVARLTGASADLPPVPLEGGLGDDVQLALYLSYEPHFSELPGVAIDAEWDPELIAFRRLLERSFEAALRRLVGSTGSGVAADGGPRQLIPAIIAADTGPSLSSYMEREGTLDQMREFVIHRSGYQLKEGDGHTFAIPRLGGHAKQLLAEIQAGEYGADEPDRKLHSALFADTMRQLDLDPRCHAYLDSMPASALAISNVISLFGLNRHRRGALVGHLSVFEMTSVAPMSRYSRALERMGAPREARRFYDVHVLADAVHEVLALDMACALAADEPKLLPDIVFGARCAVEVDRRFAERLLAGWGAPVGRETTHPLVASTERVHSPA